MRQTVRVSIKALALLEQHAAPEQVSRMRRQANIAATAVRRGVTIDVNAEVRRQIVDAQIARCFAEDTRRGGGGGGSRNGSNKRRTEALKRKIAKFAMQNRY